ncbi:MAG TPA: hypothetical protein VFL95_03580 [Gemmatimonadales bacterium]|nr:hypothetical protein [Gemmatimonadales bacterium]
MRKPILVALLLAGAAPALAAQGSYYARLGLTGASKLVTDEIIQPINTRQSLAPTLFAGVDLPLGKVYRVGLEGALSTGGFHADQKSTRYDLGTLRTASVTAQLVGPLMPGLEWRAGIGILKYLPADKTGIFARGGPLVAIFGAGADYRRPALKHWDLMLSARYDYHRFTTDELQARGFANTEGVHRISLSIGLARSSR